jgi:hypothetical protein
MNQKYLTQIASAALVGLITLTGCSLQKDPASAMSQQAQFGTGNPADQQGIPGVPGATVPTSKAAIARIQNGLSNGMAAGPNPTSGNFMKAIGQVGANLPESTNPLLATGFDQIPLLAYAACSDVPLSNYTIPGANTATGAAITTAKAAIVAAGVKILDMHMGGLASTGPNAAQVASIFGTLVDNDAKVPGETVQMTFISVCMTASAFGTQMLGF